MYTSRTLVVVDTFLIFDMSVIFEDIRDESRKLSEIVSDFGRFFTLPNFRGQPFQKGVPTLSSVARDTSSG